MIVAPTGLEAGTVTRADGKAQCRAFLNMVKKITGEKKRRITAAADKAYDTRGHVAELRQKQHHTARRAKPEP